MEVLRVLVRAPLAVSFTLACAFVAAGGRTILLGARRPSAWFGSRTCRLWGRVLCRILGIRIRVSGPRPRGTFLVASNHLSYVDILVLASVYPSVFVAKREIADWPVVGRIVRGAGTLFVDRERAKDVVRVGRAMSEHLRDGIALTLFPEGQATRGAEVLPYLPSLLEPAALTGVPCYAASISYETPGVAAPPSTTVCWFDHSSLATHAIRLMRIRVIDASVHVAETPILSSDRKELARRLWERTAATFVPIRQRETYGAQSRAGSQISGPSRSQGSRPSSVAPGSDENGTSTK